jgi:hypothetical protein
MQSQAAAETQQQQKQQQAVAEQLRRAEVSHGLHVDRSAQQAADAIDLPAGSSTEETAARECGMRGHDMHACRSAGRTAAASCRQSSQHPPPSLLPGSPPHLYLTARGVFQLPNTALMDMRSCS